MALGTTRGTSPGRSVKSRGGAEISACVLPLNNHPIAILDLTLDPKQKNAAVGVLQGLTDEANVMSWRPTGPDRFRSLHKKNCGLVSYRAICAFFGVRDGCISSAISCSIFDSLSGKQWQTSPSLRRWRSTMMDARRPSSTIPAAVHSPKRRSTSLVPPPGTSPQLPRKPSSTMESRSRDG